MTSSPPRRSFLPEPMETTARSSKRPQPTEVPNADTSHSDPTHTNAKDNMAPPSKPRKFLPQPVEESSRSSRKSNVKHVEHAALKTTGSRTDLTPIYSDDSTLPGIPNTRPPDASPRCFAPEPVETSHKSARRKFAPEPVETTSRASKDKETEESSSKPRRKFAPEPVETSARSSKDKRQEGTLKPRRNILPEPLVTETRRRRKKKEFPVEFSYAAEDGPAVVSEPSSAAASQAPSRTSSGNRKFSPELLETAKGKYRHAVVSSPSKSKHPEPESPPPEQEVADEVPPIEKSKFSAAALAKRNYEDNRRRSFMVPDLPMIESDSGDDSEAPSLTNSRSSAESELPKSTRRAAGDRYTDYVLNLAAQSATEKELQDQAMAAYINERPHEPVAHYGFDDEDEGSVRVGKLSGERGVDIRTFRRSSQDDLDWEMQNMRNHHEQLEKMKRDFKHDVAGASRFSAAALATRHHLERKEKKAKKPKADEESELAKMRAAASPPMLGGDLKFPFTISPKMTRCDTDQVPRPRTYDSEDEDDEDEEPGNQQLWNVKVNIHQNGLDGLWMGMCQQNHDEASRPTTPIRSGIQTPSFEHSNPFDTHTPGRRTPGRRGNHTPGRRMPRLWDAVNYIPLTPPRSADSEDAFTTSIDKKLLLEKQIEEEFPDRVITQIYNYLSLGYPSLAWAFDEELSKISKVTVEELRRDDQHADAKGYVGAPEGDGCGEDEVIGGRCKRWEALRTYVREWARQSPGFAAQDGVGQGIAVGNKGGGWRGGGAARKGSWGH